ncbi:hypothetical protein [Catalinimonas niigatensis]|uniref:hypothetical protein n=1 Tax=Catalinimonas niigatensis TaxID=1397264 RepID=UPI002666F240|nr:hypothetical protein [Catalinimonas niigatensis]WPP48528.1 hypothetical protein PZB72_17810 [Catalinimonas niigatensis]
MDVLKVKKALLIAFYIGVIAVGIAGFLVLRSMRHIPPPEQEQQEMAVPRADSTIGQAE